MERLSVGQILVRMGALTSEQIPKVLDFSKSNGVRFGEACLKLELCNEEQVYRALAKHFQLPFANIAGKTLPPSYIELVSKEVATEHRIVPVAAKDGRITVGHRRPDGLLRHTGQPAVPPQPQVDARSRPRATSRRPSITTTG